MAFMELSARLGLDGSAFRAGLDKAKAGVASLRSSIGSGIGSQVGGMLGVAAIVSYAKSTIDLGGKISDTSARLGISAEELQRWTFAATQTGASAENITGFFEKLTVAKAKALAGDKNAIASFKALGVSMDDLKKKKIADIALQVGKTMQSGNVEELLPSLREVGGRGVGALIPAFKGDLEAVMASAPVMSNEAVAKMDDAGDKIDEAMLRLRVPMAELLAALTPLIEFFVDGVRMIIAVLKDAGDTFVAVGTDLLAMAKLDFSFSASKASRAKDAAEGNNLDKLISRKNEEMAAEEARTAAKAALKASEPAALALEAEAKAAAATEAAVAAAKAKAVAEALDAEAKAARLAAPTPEVEAKAAAAAVAAAKAAAAAAEAEAKAVALGVEAKAAAAAAAKAAPTPKPAATAAAVAKTKPEPLPPIAPTIRDSLANIGGFTMAQNREVLDVQKDQLSTLEKIAENTDKLKYPPATVDDGLD